MIILNLYLSSFSGFSDGKESSCSAGDLGSIPEDPPREGNGYPLQYFCLKNPVDRGAWKAIVHGVAKSWTGLSDVPSCMWGEKEVGTRVKRF